MSNEERKSIAENQRSPATDAADEVTTGPPATNPEDEQRSEPPGTAEGAEPKIGPDGKPVISPSRGAVH
jgi:hypothetical protein